MSEEQLSILGDSDARDDHALSRGDSEASILTPIDPEIEAAPVETPPEPAPGFAPPAEAGATSEEGVEPPSERVTSPDLSEAALGVGDQDELSVSLASASIPPAATPIKSAPKERIVVRGPKGTAVLGVDNPLREQLHRAKAKPKDGKGPRGTEMLGVQRPDLAALRRDAAGDIPSTPTYQEISETQSFSDVPLTQQRARVRALAGGAIGLCLVVCATIALVALVRVRSGSSNASELPPSSPSAISGPATPPGAPPIEASPSPSSATSSSSIVPALVGSALPVGGPDAAAVATLEKLRIMVEGCVRQIHQLPGTSPTIPRSVSLLSQGPYKPTTRDWNAPFFNCARYRSEEAMGYMLQWQFQRAEKSGQGIAWVDADGDGRADRAYAFTAKYKGSGEVEIGPVTPIDPATKPTQTKSGPRPRM